MPGVAELYGQSTRRRDSDWNGVVSAQACPFLGKRCVKSRKSSPEVTIGTCSVDYSKLPAPVMICPHRLLQNGRIFTDAIHLLTSHQPGNEIHVVPEFSVPGGSVDYVLASVRRRKAVDFVGIELQTLDTTGTVWPARESFLASVGVDHDGDAAASDSPFGMNWKMTAKTILMQMHHKLGTFDHVNRKLVLVLQDELLHYMRREFSFGHLDDPASLGDPLQFHAYSLEVTEEQSFELQMVERVSTDVSGTAQALGLQAEVNVELGQILEGITRRLGDSTLVTFD